MNPEGNSKIISKTESFKVPRSDPFNLRLSDAFAPHVSLFKEQLTIRFLNATRKKGI